MAEKEIKIRQDEEYITLNVLLKITDLIDTGGQAKFFLQNNTVYVNGELENRRGRKCGRPPSAPPGAGCPARISAWRARTADASA